MLHFCISFSHMEAPNSGDPESGMAGDTDRDRRRLRRRILIRRMPPMVFVRDVRRREGMTFSTINGKEAHT
jgi:hypothetical protein